MTTKKNINWAKVQNDAEDHAEWLCDTLAHKIYVWAYCHGYKHGFKDAKET